jgi:hypothetical protein
LKGGYHLSGLGVDGNNVKIGHIEITAYVRMWTGEFWIRTGINGELL